MRKERQIQVSIVSKSEAKDLSFWLKKRPEERIEAVEFLRSQYYALEGYEDIPRFIPAIKIRESR